MKKTWLLFGVLVCAVISVMLCVPKTYLSESKFHRLPEVLPEDFLIAHAGGAIDGKLYSNSKEAVENSILKGVKFIEIDLQESSDGFLVGVHDWKTFNEQTGHSRLGDQVPTLSEFKKRKIYGRYTPIDEDSIRKVMNEHQNLVLVTDKINKFDKIVKAFGFQDRIIVEVFSFEDYRAAKEYGVKNPALCVEQGSFVFSESYIKRIFNEGVNMVTLGEDTYLANKELLKELRQKGLTVLLYGSPLHQIVNNAKEIKEGAGKYFDFVYTDFCAPDMACKQ